MAASRQSTPVDLAQGLAASRSARQPRPAPHAAAVNGLMQAIMALRARRERSPSTSVAPSQLPTAPVARTSGRVQAMQRAASPAGQLVQRDPFSVMTPGAGSVASVPPSQQSFGSVMMDPSQPSQPNQPSQSSQPSQPQSQWDTVDTQDTSFERNPILGPNFRLRAVGQLLQGYPCEVTDEGELSIHLGDEVPLQLELPQRLPAGSATLTLVPINAYDEYACQPRSSSVEASWILNRFRVRIQSVVTRESLDYAPFAEVINFDWDRAFRRLAEAMSARRYADRIVYTERLPDSEELDGIAVRLRDRGARFRLETHAGYTASYLDVPGNRYERMVFGATMNPSNPWLSFETPPGQWDVILRVNESTSRFDRLWYALRPSEGPGHDRAIRREEWIPLDPPQEQWQRRFWINLVRASFGCGDHELMGPPRGQGQ